jgi:hypothetical protein
MFYFLAGARFVDVSLGTNERITNCGIVIATKQRTNTQVGRSSVAQEVVHEAAPDIFYYFSSFASFRLHSFARRSVAIMARAVRAHWSGGWIRLGEICGSTFESLGYALATRAAESLARLLASALNKPVTKAGPAGLRWLYTMGIAVVRPCGRSQG